MLNTKLYLCKKARLIEVLDIISHAIRQCLYPNLSALKCVNRNNWDWIKSIWNNISARNIISNLCHFRMTPLRAMPQQVNDVPYTTPAKNGPEIDLRAYCRNVISSWPLFRMSLNGRLEASYGSIHAQIGMFQSFW